MRRTELKRGKPLAVMSERRREELKAAGNPHPVSTFKPTAKPVKSKRPTSTGPDKATVEIVAERDGYQCVVCGDGLLGPRGITWAVHHRKLRSQGVDNRPSNLICVCRADHEAIHAAPAKAREAGWIVSREDDPTQILMAHSLYGWVLLSDDGKVRRQPESEIPHE